MTVAAKRCYSHHDYQWIGTLKCIVYTGDETMDTNLKYRWLEVQLYYFIHNVTSKHNSMTDLFTLIEGLAPYGEFPAELMKATLQEVITTHYVAPTREEAILLMYRNGVPTQQIKDKWKLSGKALYKILNTDKADPRVFYPRLTKEQNKNIEKLFDAIHTIYKGVETLCLPQN